MLGHSGAPDITEEQLKNANAEEMRTWIADFQKSQKKINSQLALVEEEKMQIQDDYSTQLAKVRDEFAKLSQISVQEQERLEERVAELEQELETA